MTSATASSSGRIGCRPADNRSGPRLQHVSDRFEQVSFPARERGAPLVPSNSDHQRSTGLQYARHRKLVGRSQRLEVGEAADLADGNRTPAVRKRHEQSREVPADTAHDLPERSLGGARRVLFGGEQAIPYVAA